MWVNKIIYLAALLYSGVLAMLYTQVQCLYVFLLLLGFGIIQILIVTYEKHNIHVNVKVNTLTVNKDEPMQTSLVIENTSMLPMSCVKVIVSYENNYEHLKQYQSFLVSINANTTQVINFTLTSEHVGTIAIGVKKVVVYDLLRIFHRNVKQESRGIVKVFPEIFMMENEIMIRHQELLDSDVFSKYKSGDDPSEVFDIREYKEGDKIHRIHWKLSSKRDCIMVKEYSLPIACSAGILVNMSITGQESDKLSHYDILMAAVGSISYHMIVNEQVHFIAWYETEKEEYHSEMIYNEEDLYRVLHGLLEAKENTAANEIATVYHTLGEGHPVAKMYYLTGADFINEGEIFETYYTGTEVEAIRIIGNASEKEADAGVHLSGGIEYIETEGYKDCIEALLL